MRTLEALKARFPRLFPVMTTVLALGTVGGIVAYERLARADSCCYPGASCCHPGSPCCGSHRQAAK